MTDLTDRIAEVMDTHRPRRLRGEPVIEECQAGCTYEKGNWYIHVAEQIEAELTRPIPWKPDPDWIKK